MEIDWLVYFPKCGNKGKYRDYSVMFIDMRKGMPKSGKLVRLEDVMENREFEKLYPHTVGFYKDSPSIEAEFKPEYLEIRRINNIEEFWLFLNALDI